MMSGIRSWLTRQLASIRRATVVPRERARLSRFTPLGTTYCCQPLGGGQFVGTISVEVGLGTGDRVAVAVRLKPDRIVGLGMPG
jgi:hypothetical protein